jgi:hypothetical protein
MIGYRPQGMIADQVFPVIPVEKQTNAYAVILKDNWLRRASTQRAPGERAKQEIFSVSSDTYNAVNYALGTNVWYETQDNADPPHQPLARGLEFLKDKLMLDYEVRVCTKLQTGCGSSVSLSGTAAWSDFSNSDPTGDFRIARQAVRATTGYRPNKVVLAQKAFDYLQYHPDIIRHAYPGAGVGGMATLDKLAQVMQVENVIIGETILNTAQEGQPNTFVDVWSTQCFFLYVEPNPGLLTPTFGAAFRWGGPKIGRGGPGNFNVMQKEDDEASTTKLWTGYYQDEKIVAPELGYRIDTGI